AVGAKGRELSVEVRIGSEFASSKMIGLRRHIHREQGHGIVRDYGRAVDVKNTARAVEHDGHMGPNVCGQRLIPLQDLQVPSGIDIATQNIVARSRGQHDGGARIHAEVEDALPLTTPTPLYDGGKSFSIGYAWRQPDILIGAVEVKHMAMDRVILNGCA